MGMMMRANRPVAKTAAVVAVAKPGPVGRGPSVAKTAAVVAVATPGRGRPGPGR